MAYTNSFNATLIPGNTQAKLIDDTFRSMHAALIERLQDKLIVSATADPWVLLDTVSGRKTSKKLNVPFIDFHSLGGGNTTINTDSITCLPGANALVAPVYLPNGVTIKLVEIFVNNLNPSLSWEFYKVTQVVPFTKTNIAAGTHITQGQSVITSVALNELTDGNAGYCFSIDTSSSSGVLPFAVFGARVTYDTPTHLNTL